MDHHSLIFFIKSVFSCDSTCFVLLSVYIYFLPQEEIVTSFNCNWPLSSVGTMHLFCPYNSRKLNRVACRIDWAKFSLVFPFPPHLFR